MILKFSFIFLVSIQHVFGNISYFEESKVAFIALTQG